MSEVEGFSVFSRPTALGVSFDVHSYRVWPGHKPAEGAPREHEPAIVFALTLGDVAHDDVLVRVHSPCLFGESFGVNSCDCGEQLRMSLEQGRSEGNFLLVYLADQEGRGHGLEKKIEVIDLEANQDLEMPEAFRRKKWDLDLRQYAVAAEVVRRHVGDHTIRLLTNNPKKIEGLRSNGVRIAKDVRLIVPDPNPECLRYMRSKKREMGHLFGDL